MHRTEVDGVPAFWSDSGLPGVTASLRFRSGIADEALPRLGWTRLAAEAVVRSAELPGLDITGSLTALWTSFDITGPAEAVVAGLSRISDVLRDPGDGASQIAERIVAEATQRPSADAFGLALRWIFGAGGFGLVGFPEFGLATVTPADLRALAASRFGASDAVLCIEGTPPAGLRLGLPPGQGRSQIPAAVPVTPAGAFVGDQAEVLGAAVLPDSIPTRQMMRLLAAGVERAVPTDSWTAYDTRPLLEPLGADVLVGVSVTAPGPFAVPAAHALLSALDELCDGPVLPGDHGAQEELRPAGRAWAAAERHVLGAGRPLRPPPPDVRAAARAFRDGLYLGMPGDADLRAVPVPFAAEPAEPAVVGDRLLRAFGCGDQYDTRILAGDAGITVADRTTRQTFAWADVAGCLVGDGDVRVLVRRDGRTADVDGTQWRRGRNLVGRIDRHVGPDLQIPWPVRRAVAPRGFFERLAREARWPRSVPSHVAIHAGLVLGTLVGSFALIGGNIALTGGTGPLNALFAVALGALLCVVLIHSVLAAWGLLDYLLRRYRGRTGRRRTTAVVRERRAR
ncbi:hypothetical protein [Propionicicella superfundia]|uniref:hypothetical protein n=1 Tax=Propionicicella superfundia TaxID=348582 RepID=UPI0003FF7E4E|nr:hypothetical protein [Propionicicella superfundia]